MTTKTIKVKPQLSRLLQQHRMTQTRLSELTGISQAAISRFDESHRHEDSHIFAILHLFGISHQELFEVTFSEPEEKKA